MAEPAAPTQPAPSASALNSGRLKYADPRTLPSFPSSGLSPGGSAASAAASLGWSNQKSPEPWRPKSTSSASAAAVLAKDYKMSPAWEPSSDSSGRKAAVLAVGSAGAALKQSSGAKSDPSTDAWGSSAATQAFNTTRPAAVEPSKSTDGNSAAASAFNINRSRAAQKSPPSSSAEPDRSLLAAKGAMSSASYNRPRSTSTPSPGRNARSSLSPLEQSAASSALSGAALAHRASMRVQQPPEGAGAVPVTTMTRNMFTSHPMVKPEVDERDTNERLHQSAVTMAKKMYAQQQRMADQAKDAQVNDTGTTSGSLYLNLQDAAYKQAQDRLAKLQSEHQQSRDYQEYYGNTQNPRRRFSMADKFRRRSSSDGQIDDHLRSQKIRQEMSMFSSKLSEVDESKRARDREALLAAAQRNVKNRLQSMDDEVYSSTGKVNPNKLYEWERKAQQAAQSRSEVRNENRGKTDLGAGFFMDPEEINQIASRRVQPVLDEINERAEAERERQAAAKLEEENKKSQQEREKARERERKELSKQIKEEEKHEEKARRQQEKEEEKARREEEKAARAEQKRQAKEEKRRSKQGSAGRSAEDETMATATADAAVATEDDQVAPVDSLPSEPRTAEENDDAGSQNAAGSPSSPTSKVKGWIKNRFSRGKSIGESGEKEDRKEKKRGFLGGAAFRSSQAHEGHASAENEASSLRDMAMAGRSEDGAGCGESETARDSRGVSPVSSDSEEVEDERNHRGDGLTPPRPLDQSAGRPSSSPARDSRFREEMDQ